MGILNADNQQRVQEFLKQQYLGCPNCGALTGELHDVVGLPILTRREASGVVAGKQSIAAIPVVCSSCGFMTLFAAKGIVDLD